MPSYWATARLEDLSIQIVDGTHHTPEYVPTGVPFLSVKDIRDGKLYFDDCKFVSKATHKELARRCAPTAGDILITKSGTIGRLVVVPECQPFSLFVSVALIRLATPRLLPEYIRFALQYWVGTIDISNEIAGSAVKNLHLQDIKALSAPIPSTREQGEIVSRIERAFAAIDAVASQATRANDLLDRLDQATLARAFRGELL
jgi:type I restriction enzyme S subunit